MLTKRIQNRNVHKNNTKNMLMREKFPLERHFCRKPFGGFLVKNVLLNLGNIRRRHLKGVPLSNV